MTKLIEVALPLKAINQECAREKSIRHSHPSTMHLWWARRPLAACRVILFGQLVDDPSSVPEEFPDEAAQEEERQRLFRVIEDLVKWENSHNVHVIYAARREIARSVARAHSDPPPKTNSEIDAYLAEKAPPVFDPFCGGGSIPLEAQRLGLRAYASDLNPVAVLITKALVELPPKFHGVAPANPESRTQRDKGAEWNGTGAQGLAEDIRWYGQWVRDEAEKRIGHLYPRAMLPNGSEATTIAWLWTRTIKCPNPACGVQMPLVRSFALSTKKGKVTWVQPVVDRSTASPTIRFEVEGGKGKPPEGTVSRAGARCVACSTPVPLKHVREQGRSGRMKLQLMALVADTPRSRSYVAPSNNQMDLAPSTGEFLYVKEDQARFLAGSTPKRLTGGTCYGYGLTTWESLFTSRQLVALTTFSDLISEAREKVLEDLMALPGQPTLPSDGRPLCAGGTGATAYADAIATYLALATSRAANTNCSLAIWSSSRDQSVNAFSRQALPMTWDFPEVNPFAGAAGDFGAITASISKVVTDLPTHCIANVKQEDVCSYSQQTPKMLIATDPPYYDNIGYSDLADFFYVWLRRSLAHIHPELFRTLLTPKSSELVATPHRFGGDREKAREFFETGLSKSTDNIRSLQVPDYPMTVIYAYKQAETKSDVNGKGSTASTGWETMLSGIVNGGFAITGTWPLRTERDQGVKTGTNALASSIVLVCRPRSENAPVATRRDFAGALRRELPRAVLRLQKENIAPVDLAQAAIGPGMAVFSRYAQVLEADGSLMSVRSALIEINGVLDETLAEQEGEMDSDTRFCVAWFEQYGTSERSFGEAEVLFTAKNTSFEGLQRAGVIIGGGGTVRLMRRDELDSSWDPRSDDRIADWECVQQLARAMTAESGGGIAEAARLFGAMGSARAEIARTLAYRLFTVSERKGWTEEALAYNILVMSWAQIQAEAAKIAAGGPAQSELAL